MLFVELKQAHNAEGRYVISLALCPSNPHTLTSFVTMFLAAWLVPAASKCLWIYWRGGLGATEWRLWESCYEVAAITELSNCMLHLQVCPLNVLANQLFQICLLLKLSLVSDAPIKTKRNKSFISLIYWHLKPLYYCSQIFQKDKGYTYLLASNLGLNMKHTNSLSLIDDQRESLDLNALSPIIDILNLKAAVVAWNDL